MTTLTASAPPVNEIFLENMRALWRVDARLAQRIDDLSDVNAIEVEPSKAGEPTVAVSKPDGGRVYLHSKYRPVEEAEKFAAGVEIGGVLCFVVGGFGLGYHVKALHERLKGDAFIIVTEPSLELLRGAFESVDLSDLIRSNKCIFFVDADKGAIQERLQPLNTSIMLGAKFVMHPASQQIAGAFHGRMRAILADHMAFCKISLMTLVGNSRITARNVVNNFPAFMATPPIDVVRDRFRGYPAIIVSAGPSLQRNVHLLQEIQDKAVIIAVQTTFKPLLRAGIKPHFVTSLDYAEVSRRFFEEAGGGEDVHLIVEPKAAWQVIDEFRGPVSLLANDFAERCLGGRLTTRGGLKAGATVAHLAFYLAQYLGCDPIVFIGQDLGFSNGVFYTPGVQIHETWRPELNRYCTIEMKEWERIVRRRPILRKIKDVHGHDIYTDDMLFTYLQQFEGDFATSPAKVIDASEAGAYKSYTEITTLRQVIDRYCQREIPADRFDYMKTLSKWDASKLAAGREALAGRLSQMQEARDTIIEMMALLKKMSKLTAQPVSFNRKMIRLDELRARVYRDDTVMLLITSVSQHAELRRYAADRKIGLDGPEGAERAKRQLERDIEFLEALMDGVTFLEDTFAEGLARFDEASDEASEGHV